MQNTVDKQSDEAKEVSIIVDSYNVILSGVGFPQPLSVRAAQRGTTTSHTA